jgi:hypothetical protein
MLYSSKDTEIKDELYIKIHLKNLHPSKVNTKITSTSPNTVETKMLHMGKVVSLYFIFFISFISYFLSKGLLRLQQIYQGLNPGNETFQVEIVKRINNVTDAIEFLQKIEQLNRWSRKFVVLDCPTDMAKEIVKTHVRDVTLGKRTYHYLLSGLVSIFLCPLFLNIAISCFTYEYNKFSSEGFLVVFVFPTRV